MELPTAASFGTKRPARKDELLKELKAVEDAIARKRAKIDWLNWMFGVITVKMYKKNSTAQWGRHSKSAMKTQEQRS